MWVYGLSSQYWLNICICRMYIHHVCWRTLKKKRRVRDSKSFLKHYAQECVLIMKQSGVQIEDYRLQQNNSPPHTATSTLLELDVLGFERIDHLAYSPWLASFYVDVYPKVKSQLKGRRFSSHPELRSATANIISKYNQDWYRAIFNKWVKWYVYYIENV